MTEQTKPVLKTYFTTGAKPTEQNFVDLIDSFVTETSAGSGDIPNNRILANIIGVSAAATGNTLSGILDATVTAARGSILFRAAGGWVSLSPGTNGQLLATGGPAADISWTTAAGTGSVTSVSAGGGLTASTNPITTAGDISLAQIPAKRLMANITGVSAAPVANTLSSMIDAEVSGVQGGVLYRNATAWVALPNGTAGQVLTAGGVSANVSWGNAGSMTTVYDAAVSAQTSVDVSGLSTYKQIRITGDFTVSTSNGIQIQTKTSATYYEAGTDYSWQHTGSSGNSSTAASAMNVGDATLATARKVTAVITSLGDANMPTILDHKIMTANPFIYVGMGYRNAATAENGIRIKTTTGTFSGRLKVEAI